MAPPKPYTPRTSTLDADQPVVTRHIMKKMIQVCALLTPPILLARQAWKRQLSISRLLRGTTASTFVIGPGLGYAMAWGRMRNMEEEGVVDRAYRIRMNATQQRCDDYAAVGGVLGALLTTTIFMRRASVLWTVPGGAALGIAGGVITHIVTDARSVTGPNVMLEEVKQIKEDIKEGYPGKAIVEKGEDGVKEALEGK